MRSRTVLIAAGLCAKTQLACGFRGSWWFFGRRDRGVVSREGGGIVGGDVPGGITLGGTVFPRAGGFALVPAGGVLFGGSAFVGGAFELLDFVSGP